MIGVRYYPAGCPRHPGWIFRLPHKRFVDSAPFIDTLNPRMNVPRLPLAILATAALSFASLQAQSDTATTDPVGFMTIDLPVGSDTIVAAPLSKAPVFQGAVTSLEGFVVTSTGANFGDLTTAPHYVQAVDGAQAGIIFDVQSNTTDAITLVNNGVSPTGLSAGTKFKVIPYWTLGTLFPASDAGVSFTASTATTTVGRRTQVLIPNTTGTGINRSASATYFFYGTYWRSTAATSVDANNTPLLPDSYFIVRNTANSAAGKLTVAGSVNTSKMAVQLDRTASGNNDNYVSVSRPIDIKLKDLGLIESGAFTASAGTTTVARRDQLLVYNNASIGINKSASATYYYLSSASQWRSTSDSATDAGDTLIPAASGLVIRKYGGADGSSFWTNSISIAQ